MSNIISPFDLYQIARELERNGEVFYRNAAERVSDPAAIQMLLGLAKAEVQHEKLLAEMQAALSEEEKQPAAFASTERRADLFLGLIAGNVFDPKAAAEEDFFTNPSLKDILNKAIAIEKDSVIFYLGFRDIVRTAEAEERLNALINQELSHIYTLNEYLHVI